MTLPVQPPLPHDADDIPVMGGYSPNSGIAALQLGPVSTDNNGVVSAPTVVTTTASSTVALTSVGGAATSTSILAANTSRKAAYIYNDSSSAMYLALGGTASTTAFSFKVPANNLFELPTSPVWQGALSALWDTATGNARVTEVS